MAGLMGGNLAWLWVSLVTSAMWGVQYAFWGQLSRAMSPSASIFWYGVMTFFLYSCVMLWRGQGFETAKLHFNSPILWLLVGCAVLGVAANIGSITGFRMKNATLVTMIQASHPLFTGLFTWAVFRDYQFNPTILAGYVLILVGVGVVAFGEEG